MTLNLLLAVGFGLLLGVGLSVALEYFDTSFRNVSDVEGRLQLPVMCVIPVSRHPGRLDPDDPSEAEPFRVLQTNINLALVAGRPSSLVLLSAGPGEGKSTVAHQLAYSMAAAGERVLLVDSDVRRPTQHRLFGQSRAPGFVNVLLNRAKVEDVIRRSVCPGLDFLASGEGAGFSLSMLYANRLREFLAQWKTNYDRVVLDSPPIIGVSDASVLTSLVNGAVLLIQYRRNPQSMVLRARQIIDGLKTPILGVVLSQVPQGTGDDYSYYTKNYAYYGDSHRPRRKPSSSGPAAPAHRGERIALREPDPDGGRH